MPLLISSRMTSAGLTASSSASSFTVIVDGSSIAPRSRGSIVWTADWASPGRRGGLRGPRRPRVPLLLLATRCSSWCHRHVRWSGQERLPELRRDRCLERAPDGAPLDGEGPATGVATEVGTPAGEAAAFIDLDPAIRRPNDPDELPLRPGGATGNARPGGNASRGDDPWPGYVPTSSVAFLLGLRVFFGAGASVPFAASVAAVAAAFFARGFVAGAATASAAGSGSVSVFAAFFARGFAAV